MIKRYLLTEHMMNLINTMKFMEHSNAFHNFKNYLKLETDFEGEKWLCFMKLKQTFRRQMSFRFLCRGKGNTLLGKPAVPSKIIPTVNIPTQSFMNFHRTPINCIFTEFLSSYLSFTLENAASVTLF